MLGVSLLWRRGFSAVLCLSAHHLHLWGATQPQCKQLLWLCAFLSEYPLDRRKDPHCALALLCFPCKRMSLESHLRVLVRKRESRMRWQLRVVCWCLSAILWRKHITIKSTRAPQIHFAKLPHCSLGSSSSSVLRNAPYRWEHRSWRLLVCGVCPFPWCSRAGGFMSVVRAPFPGVTVTLTWCRHNI